MIIDDFTHDKVLRDYFFIEGTINLNASYFINKLKEGFNRYDNKSYNTNIKGKMTAWEFLVKDKYFLKIIDQFIPAVDNKIKLPKYHLTEAWGFCAQPNDDTREHDHEPSPWGGVIYLNDHEQTLDFNEINKKVKPAKGKFALFSGFIQHGCKPNKTKEKKWGMSFNMGYTSHQYE